MHSPKNDNFSPIKTSLFLYKEKATEDLVHFGEQTPEIPPYQNPPEEEPNYEEPMRN